MRRAASGSLAVAAALAAMVLPVTARAIAQGPPPIPPATTAPAARASAAIAGRVVDGTTGTPIRDAVVTVSGRGFIAPVFTDGNGRFAFDGLAPGPLSVTAMRNGHYGGLYGQRRPTGPPQSLQLGDGERLLDVTLRLWRFAAITGTVLDELGEPVVGLPVWAYAKTLVAGRPVIHSSAGTTARTDDRGVFRIARLQPGSYVVGLPLSENAVPLSMVEATALAGYAGSPGVRNLSRGLTDAGMDGDLPGSTYVHVIDGQVRSYWNNTAVPPPPDATGRIQAYAAMFFSGANTPGLAQPIVLAPGDERAGVDLRLRLVPTVRVSGRLTSREGPAANVALRLVPIGADASSSDLPVARTLSDARGAFTFLAVPPGQYEARVTTSALEMSPSFVQESQAMSAVPGPDDVRWYTHTPISVGTSDVKDLEIPLQRGVRVSGRVQFDRAPAMAPDQVRRVVVRLERADGRGQESGLGIARVDPQGRFQTNELPPGKYVVRVTSTTSGWSANIGGRDVSVAPLEVIDREIDNLVVTVGEPATQLSGTLIAPLNGHSVIAGDDGRFLLSNVPAGRYNLSVRRDGYVGTIYGARRPGGPGTQLVVADGQRIANLVVRIQKGAAITGAITDRHGDRAADARVVLYRIRVVDGERRLEQADSVTADDRGIYRVHSLAPGEYVVTATSPLRTGESGVRELSEQELQAVYQPRSPTVGIAPIRPAASMGAPPPVAPPPSPVLVSAPVFYPGVLTASLAEPIRVAAGEERTGVDFAAQLVPAGRIEGQVIDPGGRSDMTVTVTLNSSSPMTVNPSRSVNIRMIEQGGRFTISGVLPGEYAIHAQARVTPAPPQTGIPAPPPVLLWGRTDVVTTGADMTGVAILLQPSLNLSGRVVLERTRPARPNDTGTIRVLLENFAPAGMGSAQRQLSATAGADGRFTLIGVGPGRYRLAALVTGPSASEWVLKSAMLNGQNAMDVPVEINPGSSPGETILTLTDRGTELSGHLLDQAGRPAPSHYVVVLAADRSMWLRGSRRQVSVRPASDGQYSVRNLPPGEYLIAAVTDMDIADLSDTAFLEMLVPAAMKVTLHDGERKVQELRVGR